MNNVIAMKQALEQFKQGNIVLVYDSDSRENETDMVIAAEHVTPEIIEVLRKDAGGLICCCVTSARAQDIGLPFMRDVYKAAVQEWSLLQGLSPNKLKYDSRSSFSITVNHKDCFTGISDNDRALTIKEMVNVKSTADFQENFNGPGHVHMLIGAAKLTEERQGHTELSLAMAEMAGTKPVTVVCEMLSSGVSMSRDTARQYAEEHGLAFIDGADIIKEYSNVKQQ